MNRRIATDLPPLQPYPSPPSDSADAFAATRLIGGQIIADADGCLVEWSEAALHMHGFQSLEEVQTHVSNFFGMFEIRTLNGEVIAHDNWPLPRLMRGERFDNWEVRLCRLDTGDDRYITYTGTRVELHGVVFYALSLQDLTQWRRAIETLRDTERRLSGIVRTAVDGIITTDEHGAIESVNPAVTRIFGYDEREMIGRSVSMLIPDSDDVRHMPSAAEGECLGRRRDGSTFPIERSIGQMCLGDRRVCTSIVRDITLRKDAERQLRDSHALMHALVEGIPDPVYIKGRDGRYQYVNSAFASGAGRTPAACVGVNDGELFGAEVGEMARKTDEMVLSMAEPVTFERGLWWNGVRRHYLSTKTPYRQSDGHVAGIIGLARDITDQKRSAEALRHSADHLRDMLDSLMVNVVVLTAAGQIRGFNARTNETLTQLGVSPENVKGIALVDLPLLARVESTRRLVSQAIGRAASGTTVRLTDLEVVTDEQPPRRAFFDVTMAPLIEENDTPVTEALPVIGRAPTISETQPPPRREVICSAVDVTERVVAERRARDQQAELAHLDRVRTMGHMAAGLAHELNQPLSAIVNFASAARLMVREGRVGVSGIDDILGDVVRETSRASEIIRRMRAFVKKSPIQLQVVNANDLVTDALTIMAFELREAHIVPEVSLLAEVPATRVHADVVQITQVFVNLIRNAIDAMASVPERERWLAIRVTRLAAGTVEFRVEDAGTGVSADELPRLFDAFFTTKKAGLGMGLALCRIIIEDHGGHIVAGHRQPRGMHLSFTLKPA